MPARIFFVPSSFLAEEQTVTWRFPLIVAGTCSAHFCLIISLRRARFFPIKISLFTQFRFYRAEDYTISEYSTPLQSVTGWVWAALLAVAAVSLRLLLSRKTYVWLFPCWDASGWICCFISDMARSYSSILQTGRMPLSCCWGSSWRICLHINGFSTVLIAFLALLTLNNAALIHTIMETSAPYIY